MDLMSLDVVVLLQPVGNFLTRWAAPLGLFADVLGFMIITASAFRVRKIERRAKDEEAKSTVYVHMLEQMTAKAPRERRALQARSQELEQDLRALEERLKGQGDWYRDERARYETEAGQLRVLGFRMEGRALGWGAGLIICGTALQLFASWPT